MKEMRILAASGQLGYGFTEEALSAALSGGVDFIGCDAGSMDPGPYYLGAGVPFVSELALRRDLELLLTAAVEHGVPLLIGSAGGGGGTPHLARVRSLISEIARERQLHFPLAVIHAEPPREVLAAKLHAGAIAPLGPIAPLDDATLSRAERIVAMMGIEPYQAALARGAQVVLAGRSSDAAIFSAIPIAEGYPAGLAWHLGKIIECAGQVIEPRVGQDSVLGRLGAESFVVEPAHPEKRCTLRRVAGHTLYETADPFRIEEPGGTLDTSGARFAQVDERAVRVSGSRFEPAARYTVKLEGVEDAGFRSVFFAGVRDPRLVADIEDFVAACHGRVEAEAGRLGIAPDAYRLEVRVYGRNAVMGTREPIREPAGHELGLLVEVVAAQETLAAAVLAKARYALLHTDFPGRQCIAGNLAFPFSPSDVPVGRVYRFSVWHTVELDDPLELFPIELVDQ